MLNITKKFPVGVAALAVVSILGLKDTGIFISDHVQTTYSGNQVFFEIGEKAEIIEESARGYIVAKGPARVTIPREKIAVTEATIEKFKVVSSSALKNAENDILRNLFLGEVVTLDYKDNDTYIVTTEDGLKGRVNAWALEPFSKEVVAINQDEAINKAKTQAQAQEIKVEKTANIVPVTTNTITYSNETVKPIAETVINSALSKLGKPYIYASTGPNGYDCSGLVYAIYKNELGINLPRTSREQSQFGQQIAKDQLQPGDLVFFNTSGSGVSHVGIYQGNGNFIHASSGKDQVMISNLSETYYSTRYVNATRVLN